MVAQLIHAQEWGSYLLDSKELVAKSTNCLVVGFQVEREADRNKIEKMVSDVHRHTEKLSNILIDAGSDPITTIAVEPFRHLSSSHLDYITARSISDEIVCRFRENGKYEIRTSPFGAEKLWSIFTHGHRLAFAFRSY